MIWRLFVLLGAIGLVLSVNPARAESKLKVVATFSILGDMVRNVGGDRIDLTILVGANGDAHVYTPTPRDAAALAKADAIFINGLGFEGWIGRLIDASGSTAPVIVASDGVHAREMAFGQGGSAHGADDPHAWQSIENGIVYVNNIARGLAEIDPSHTVFYRVNADSYKVELAALDRKAKRMFSEIPAERRKVVTSHDAFGYFERSYKVEFLAPVGVSTKGEASVADVARLIRQIRQEKLSAVFLENVTDPSLLKQIARETGVKIGGRIYSDALSGEDEPAATYIKMFSHNIEALAKAMQRVP